MDSYHKVNFFTASEFLKEIGNKLSKKMFAYVRDTLHLIPPPVKTSGGKGIIALYPECAVRFLQRVLLLQSKGKTLTDIKKELKKELDEVFREAKFWREEFTLNKRAKKEAIEFLREANLPAFPFKLDLKKDDIIIKTARVDTEAIKQELKKLFRSWDGKSMAEVVEIKKKIEELENVEFNKRISKQLSPLKVYYGKRKS